MLDNVVGEETGVDSGNRGVRGVQAGASEMRGNKASEGSFYGARASSLPHSAVAAHPGSAREREGEGLRCT